MSSNTDLQQMVTSIEAKPADPYGELGEFDVSKANAINRAGLKVVAPYDAMKAERDNLALQLTAALAERDEAHRTSFRLEGMIEMLRKHEAADRAELHSRISNMATQNADQAAQIAELIAERNQATEEAERLNQQWAHHVVEQVDQPQMFGPSNMREWHAVFTNMQNMITEDLRPVFEARIREEQARYERISDLCQTQQGELENLRYANDKFDMQCGAQQHEIECLHRELDAERTKATQATIEKEQALVRSADTTLMLAELKAIQTSWSLLSHAPAFGVGALAACVVFWLVGVAL